MNRLFPRTAFLRVRPHVLALLALVPAVLSARTPLVLISLDAFRWDYCTLHPAETSNLRRLKAQGVSARALIPVFPSNTFPNHYTLVTGLFPAHHGIVDNDFFDADSGRFFHSNQAILVHDPRWWKGEPIWVTAEKQGVKSAASFWVGAETEIGGQRPSYWRAYDPKIPFEDRLRELLAWLALPPDRRPGFIAFYLEEANSAGHTFGPDSPELAETLGLLDRRVGELLEQIHRTGTEFNLVVVSDHGMTSVDAQHAIILEDHLDPSSVQIDFEGSVAGMRPTRGSAEDLVTTLGKIPHLKAFTAENLPAQFHVELSPRTPPVWVLAEEGWQFISRAGFKRNANRFPGITYLRGDHGYDPAIQTMRGIFIATGPSFRSGIELPEVENIQVYELLCAALGLTPAKNDGSPQLASAVLRPANADRK